jgi:hypothetical protein
LKYTKNIILMDKYIKYLIEDIRKASINLPKAPYIELDEEDECLRGVMEYESIDEKPMQEWFQLSKDSFPPVEKLNNTQLNLLVSEILKLWKAYNFDPVLPENLPVDITYKLLVDSMETPVIWVSEGSIGIEFCDYDTENCPFPQEYCMCKDFNLDFNEKNCIDEEIEEEEGDFPTDLPFNDLPSKRNKHDDDIDLPF